MGWCAQVLRHKLFVRHDINRVSDLACFSNLKDIQDFAEFPDNELIALQRVCEQETQHWKSYRGAVSERAVDHHFAKDGFKCVRDRVTLASNHIINNKGLGPEAAAKRLKVVLTSDASRCEWIEKARITALLGSSVKPHGSFLSGVRFYFHFTDSLPNLKGREFSPSVECLLAWSTLFCCGATF